MDLVCVSVLVSAGRVWPWWGGYGWPWGLLWLGVAVLFWGGLIALLVWAIVAANGSRRRPDTALQVLKRRLASGEISQDEYERIRRLITD